MRLSLLIAALVLGLVAGIALVRNCDATGLAGCATQLTAERVIAYATVLLAFLTLIVAYAAWHSADAASRAARVLPQLERAYLFEAVAMTPPFTDLATGVDLGEKPALHYHVTLTNFGRTPAIVRRLSCGADHASPMPAESAYPRLDIGPELVLMPGARHDFEVHDSDTLDAGLVAEIHRGNVYPKLFGRIDYDDIFGEPHVTAWHWAYNGKDDTFQPFPWKGRRANHRQ